MMDIYGDQQLATAAELAKFESVTGIERMVIDAYITKSKESAHARMVGGVCVAGDNPERGELNQWDMSSYFQMVLMDREAQQCIGLALLHRYEADGETVLTASFNPSSTFLFRADEAAVFNGMMGALEEFADDNEINIIASSVSSQIRSNRTGGLFEATLKERIASVDQQVAFDPEVPFSYNPAYTMGNMDVLWRAK